MKYALNLFLSTGLSALMLTACGPSGESDDAASLAGLNQKPVAVALVPTLVVRQLVVELDATGSSDPNNDSLSYQWKQTTGPDVTEGVGHLTGANATFYAPDAVGSLQFDLIVNDGTEDSEPDSFFMMVLESDNAYFVDGDLGDDTTGLGSQSSPFASIAYALCQITDAQEDIYVKNRADNQVYIETTDPCPGDASAPRATSLILSIPTGTSLYGGFSDNWHRDLTETTIVNTLHSGFIFNSVDEDAWFSGFNVVALPPESASNTVTALSALSGSANLYVEDNQLTAGDVPTDLVPDPGSSISLVAGNIGHISITRNIIFSGFGGNASNYETTFSVAATAGGDGQNATGGTGGSGGAGANESYNNNGGRGGNRDGFGSNVYLFNNQGDDGAPGSGGDSVGLLVTGTADDTWYVNYQCGNGTTGSSGIRGAGGDGGDGGDSYFVFNGGGGGGGGGGGNGGTGGIAGAAGCASIGIMLTNISSTNLIDNIIYTSSGGNGGSGGIGQTGGSGGDGGDGACGTGSTECTANGEAGSNGKDGGDGGRGGAGGGGPSIGIMIGENMAPYIENNDITSGEGGKGGDGGTNGNGGNGGHSYAIYDTDLNDGMSPTITNNSLTNGSAGSGGGNSGVRGSAGIFGATDLVNW